MRVLLLVALGGRARAHVECTPENSDGLPVTTTAHRASNAFLQWAGYTFSVKSGQGGPGPNTFSTANAFVNATTGDLTLLLRQNAVSGQWECAEVALLTSLGYGTYSWALRADSTVGFDKAAVLGLFTYESDDREIDIEFSAWDNLFSNVNADFAVQPATVKRFFAGPESSDLLFANYTWAPGRVDFMCCNGVAWSHTGADVPPPGGERVHMNVWLFKGAPPASGWGGASVRLQNFSFAPR